MTKVQIIVPLYNMESYIAKTIDSLLKQTLKEIEILCINDGSTDASLKILETYALKDDRVKIFTKENGGIADARNFGLSKVTAPYFAFVDSDDTVEADFIEEMLQKALDTKADFVTCDFWWSYENKEVLQKDGPHESKKELLISMFATLWNKLYRTEWVKSLDIHFPTGYRYEDASFLYKIVPYLKSWSYIDKPFVHYLQREGSITHNHNEKVKDMIFVFEDLIKFYHERGLFESHKSELEYLFIRFFLGNSFLRTCQIKDKKDRKTTLSLSYKILIDNFPDWNKNGYLKKAGLKNKYFKLINKFTYPLFAQIFTFVYSLK